MGIDLYHIFLTQWDYPKSGRGIFVHQGESKEKRKNEWSSWNHLTTSLTLLTVSIINKCQATVYYYDGLFIVNAVDTFVYRCEFKFFAHLFCLVI